MKLLILGGTVFIGRHLVDAALERGHEVTLFNRGQHNADLYPMAERLRGDRDGDLTALRGRRWDAVVDTCGYVPRVVRASAEELADAVDHYTFISTISVYPDLGSKDIDEEAPLATLDDPSVEEVTGETYGGLKVLCERAVEQVIPGRALIVRPGLIVGPHDSSDRFTYWPHRVARGGEALAPGRSEYPTQFIDARDLMDWSLQAVERRLTGVYNATGPAYTMTMGHVLDTCKDISGSDARFTWVDDSFLTEAGVAPYTELPLWVPATPEMAGFATVDCGKAIAAGLTYRPLADTVRDTLAWDQTRPADTERANGLKSEREAELLRSWHSRAENHEG